jgi:hypothetical protein
LGWAFGAPTVPVAVTAGGVVAGFGERDGAGAELGVAEGVGEADGEELTDGVGAADGRTGTARPEGVADDVLGDASGTLARTSCGSAPSLEGGS